MKFQILDSMVSSILNYGSELWGFHPAEGIERLHYKFCKLLLGVKRSTNNMAILGELSRFPFYIVRKFHIIKYWIKILSNKNSLLYRTYNLLRIDADSDIDYKGQNWASNVKQLLNLLGLNNLWIFQDTIVPIFNVIKRRIIDQFLQSWHGTLLDSNKMNTYAQFKTDFTKEKYLDVIRETHLRRCLSQFRLSAHKLNIESYRFTNVDRDTRLCKCCNMNMVENEYHFLLICPLYSVLRKRYFSNYYCQWPNLNKFRSLLSVSSNKCLYKLAKYLNDANKMREDYLDKNN
jgi:hypothetical protein